MKVAFLGDIALIGKYDITKNKDAKSRLEVLARKLDEFDYVIGNLESPLTNESKTLVCKSMHLRTPVENIELLKYLNIDAVSLANNHLYDYGRKGLLDTIETLDMNGIEWFGANKKYLNKEIGGEKLSISGFCCYSTNGSGYITDKKNTGINLLTYDNVIKQLNTDKENGALSISAFHWGDEHTNYPKLDHINLAKKLVDRKDVVICGHHPHIIQGVQSIKNSLVAYSLGNFLFDDCVSITGSFQLKQNDNNKKSFILEVEINDGVIVNHKYHGFRDEEDGFVFYDIDDEIHEISKPLNKIGDINNYQDMRSSQINRVIYEKFGKRDMKWLMSRMNYYAIGAFITTKLRKKKYIEVARKFSDRG